MKNDTVISLLLHMSQKSRTKFLKIKLQIPFRNVVKGYGRMRLTSMEAEEMLKTADIDTDGLISYEEFVKLFCGKA